MSTLISETVVETLIAEVMKLFHLLIMNVVDSVTQWLPVYFLNRLA